MEIQGANRLAPFPHGQMNCSLLGHDVERDVIPVMRRNGLGLTVWSPLASGFLSGKYTRENLTDPDNRYFGFDILTFDKEHGFRVVERKRISAAEHHASAVQVAIAWLLSSNAVTSVILGASKPYQLADNLGSIEVRLGADEIAALDAATPLASAYPNWFIDNLADGPVTQALDRP